MTKTHERMKFADFTRTFHNLWGGTKIGMDTHALRRGCQRFYPLLSYELLAENIRSIFLSGGAELEELAMGVELGGMFTIYDESSHMAILASIDFDQTVGVNEVFVNTIYVRRFQEPIYCEHETKLRCKIGADGSVTENPPELVLKPPR
ncbi:hypothetical protein [Flavonifractor sp. An306]|uniref:hypothetical protein n=1 Tax=Flavonifractor sp. An306 TaxID=1965629 RepID=UPI00174BBE17|nr:hypothetical protein [Flavonifractor sp. An306]